MARKAPKPVEPEPADGAAIGGAAAVAAAEAAAGELSSPATVAADALSGNEPAEGLVTAVANSELWPPAGATAEAEKPAAAAPDAAAAAAEAATPKGGDEPTDSSTGPVAVAALDSEAVVPADAR